MSPDSAVYRWDIALNEAAGTISYTIENGARVQNHPALFTANEVSWDTVTRRSLISGGGLTINRVDLTFTRHPMQVGNNPPSGGAVGQCQVAVRRRRFRVARMKPRVKKLATPPRWTACSSVWPSEPHLSFYASATRQRKRSSNITYHRRNVGPA